MAYPKTTTAQKEAFIAKVSIKLESLNLMDKLIHLEGVMNLEKQYILAQRYDREMRKAESEGTLSPQPSSDFDIAAASDDEITEETEESEYSVTSMTAEEVQECIHNHPSKSRYKQKQQNTIKKQSRERRKELLERHYEILDWLQCIDDGIVKGDIHEAKKMIDTLDSYADRLHHLLDTVYVDRAKKVYMQLMEIESVLGKEDMEKIRKEVEGCVPIEA